jgi:NAD(P)-dependent dehydrogenase (short-subunit alcohol dehydrogenase family)
LVGAADEAALKQALFDRARLDGNSPTPGQIGERARAVLAQREVRATLDAMHTAGSEVRYISCDVQDEAALRAALAEVRAQWGPITGVVHAAGILADKPIGEKTDGQFAAVFDTKVLGLRTVLAATAEDPLRLLCMFSSITARVGNQGQSDYAMANEVLNQVASAERARRPDCLVRAICWGPWDGGMVDTALAEHFRRQGVPLMSVGAGARAFVAELEGSAEEVQVVLGAGGEPLPLSQAAPFEVQVDAHSHPYLADHCVAGARVVPMALAIEWFAHAADGDGPLALREVEVVRGIQLLDEPMWLEIAGSADKLELRAADGTLHYRAIAGHVERPQLVDVMAPSALAPLDRVIYDGHVLFHGPRFQAIRAFEGRAATGAVSELIGTAALGWPGRDWKTDPAALDGCLQTAVVWAEGVLGGASLPMAIAECRVHRPGLGPSSLRCVVRAGEARELEAICDIVLLDGDGGVRTELLGVTVVLRPNGHGPRRGGRLFQPES